MYRQSENNLLNSNTSSTCADNMANFGVLTAEICWWVWGTPANFNGFRVLTALLHGSLVVSVSQTLRRWTEGSTYIRQGGYHVEHWPTFLVSVVLQARALRIGTFKDRPSGSCYPCPQLPLSRPTFFDFSVEFGHVLCRKEHCCVVHALPDVPDLAVILHTTKISCLLMAALWNRAGDYIFTLWFLSSFLFLA